MDKKKIIWGVLFLVISVLTVWTIVSQSKSFSPELFLQFLREADKGWMAAAVVSMFCFIAFEGIAIARIVTNLGYPQNRNQGLLYGAADVFFSAITPSASGGQPASAYFMIQDGIPGTAVTVSLLINLVMYTLALLSLGGLCMTFRFDIFMQFSLVSKLFIIFGILVLSVMGIVFYLLLKRANILYGICNGVLVLLSGMHLLRHGERKREKLNQTMEKYQECARVITGKWIFLLEIYFWNVLQRLSQLAVSFMVFMAIGSGVRQSLKIMIVQCLAAVGSNSVPIPGSMGVADYLMIDGFSQVVGTAAGTSLGLICRGLMFYLCVITSCLIVLFGCIRRKLRDKKKS